MPFQDHFRGPVGVLGSLRSPVLLLVLLVCAFGWLATFAEAQDEPVAWPDDVVGWTFECDLTCIGDPPERISELEGIASDEMIQAGKWLRGLGFNAPLLNRDPDYPSKYLGVFQRTDADHGTYESSSKVLTLNPDTLLAVDPSLNSIPNNDVYSAQVHELFHAIQSNYKGWSSAAGRDWICLLYTSPSPRDS